MRKAILGLFLILVLLAACSQREQTPEATPVEQATEQLPTEASITSATVAPTLTVVPSEPTAEPPERTGEPVVDTPPTVPPPAPTATELPATEEAPLESATVNGYYENTFFRGAAAAPVTMLDYSDFL